LPQLIVAMQPASGRDALPPRALNPGCCHLLDSGQGETWFYRILSRRRLEVRSPQATSSSSVTSTDTNWSE